MFENSLLVIVVLADDLNIVSYKIHRVESHTKLANQVDISALLHLLKESCKLQKRMSVSRAERIR